MAPKSYTKEPTLTFEFTTKQLAYLTAKNKGYKHPPQLLRTTKLRSPSPARKKNTIPDKTSVLPYNIQFLPCDRGDHGKKIQFTRIRMQFAPLLNTLTDPSLLLEIAVRIIATTCQIRMHALNWLMTSTWMQGNKITWNHGRRRTIYIRVDGKSSVKLTSTVKPYRTDWGEEESGWEQYIKQSPYTPCIAPSNVVEANR